MASLIDLYKQKLAPVAQKLSGIVGIGNFSPINVQPAQQFVSGALKGPTEAISTFGKNTYEALIKQPKLTRQMQTDTQKLIDASNRALQTAKAAREAGRHDLAAQYTRSMLPNIQAESQRFGQTASDLQAKQKALLGSGVRTGLYASSLLNPLASVGAGALGTGIQAAFTKDRSPEQLGQAFGEGFKYGGMPNPAIKGGLVAKAVGGGLVNLAEDMFYAKTVENRNLTPKEVALSLAIPATFETGSQFLKQIKGKPKIDIQTTPDGLMFNKSGQLFDPKSGQFAKNTREARLAAKNTKDFIAAGGIPVKAGSRLVEISPNKWVTEQSLQTYASEIDTPKLKTEPVAQGGLGDIGKMGGDPLVEKFGTTTTPMETAFIAKNGEWINGGLRKTPMELGHKKMSEIIGGHTNKDINSITDLQARTGAIRVVPTPKVLNVDVVGMPSQAQLKSIEKLSEGNPITADISPTTKGGRIKSGHFKSFSEFEKWLNKSLSPSKGGVGDIKPITAYHGSDTKIEKFDLNKVGSNTDSGMFGKGIYFSGSPKEASTYARNTGNISEYQLNLKNPYVIKSQADIPDIKAIGTKEYSEKFTKYLQDRGFDGVIDEISPNKQYVVFDPKQISLSPSKGGVTEPKIVKPLKEVYKEKLTTGENIPQLSTPQETAQQISSLTQPPLVKPIQQPELPIVQRVNKSPKLDQASESIIQEARKQIGESPEPPKANLKQTFDNLYTQWVDRYNPLTQASKKAQGALKEQGAVLRPEYDPTYLVRRLTGAGGIADQRFQTQLNPILKEMEQLNIPKADMDVYLANRRIAGFGTAGRDIYGADPKKAGEVVAALNAKYPNIDSVAQKFYAYQDEGLKQIADAGFLSPEDMAKIKSQNPDYSPLYRVMDEMDDYLGLPTRKTQQATSPITKIKGSTRQIESPVESIIGNTFRQRAAIEKNRVAQSIVNLQNMADMGFEKVAKSGTDTISVWNNGKKEFWKVGQDIADTAKGVNEESMNVVLKLLQAPATLLRQGATGRNPEFILPNVIRDQLDAAVTSKYGYVPFVDYLSGLKSMLTNDDIYQRWANSGAKIDLGELSGKKSIKQLFDSKVEKKKLGDWLSQGLDVLGKYSEQPTRVGLFKKAYRKTGNELIAALESRDATVDFARMGSKMKVANSIVPFLNVGVQGFDKLVRAVKDNPGKVAFTLATYAVAPQVISTMYNLIKYPEEYKDIPDYEKQSNFVFINGRNEDGTVNYVTIPKGNVVPIAANPAQSFLEYAFSNDPGSFKEMALNTLSGTLPVLGQGSSLKEIGVKTIGQNLPQAIKPITENLLNKSFYKYDTKKEQNKEIVPSYLQNRPAYLQKYDFTPKMYEKIGAALNVSPLKVQNLMEGYLAGYSKIPAQILDSMNIISQGKEVSNNDKTILRRFVKTTYPSSGKPAPETPPVPSFMERITGKAGASEKAGSNKTYWYTDDSGNSKSIKIGKVTSLPESTNYERVKKDQEKWKLADDILNLPAEQQQKAFTDLGISKADAEYYQVAKDTTEAKVAYIKDQVQGVKTYEEFLKKVIPLAKEINGSSILSSGVIDWLYNNKIITSAQKKQLKSLEFKDGKVQVKSGSTKSTYVEAKLPASAKTALPKVKRIRTKTYKLVVPKAK